MIRTAIDGAFARIDTMESFERVMTVMTGSTEKAKEALEGARLTVKGTAYGLDVAAKSVQDFVTRGMEVGKATDTFAIWADAVSFYGDGSNEQLRTVMDALAKMTTSGKVGMDQMNRLFDAGIDAVGMYAKAVGRDAESVQKDLSNGKIRAEEFIDVVSKAMEEGTNGVQKISGSAKEAGASWMGTFDNMQAAVNRGVVNIIQAIDGMLTTNGLPDMRTMVAVFGAKFEEVLNKAAEAIPKVVEKVKEVYTNLEPWMPLITGLALALGTFVTAIATMNSTVAIATTVWKALSKALSMNPWMALAAAIITVAVLVYTHWEPIKEFFINLWESIKEIGLAVWEPIKETWNTTVSYLKELFAPTIEFFSNLWSSVVEGGTSIWSTLTETLSTVWENIKTIASSYWEIIKNVILGPILLLINLVTGDMEEFKSNLSAIWENIQNAASRIWESIRNIFNSVMDGIKTIIDNAWNFIQGLWIKALEFILNAVGVNFESIRENIQNILDAVKNIIDTVWNYIKNSFNNALDFVKALVTGDFEGMKNAIKSQMENIRTTISNIWESVKSIFANLIGAIITVVKQKFTDIVNSVREKMNETKAKIEEGWNKAKEFLTGIDLKQIGKDIIDGLINGIKSKITAVGNAIKDVTDQITGKIKSILGIASPSKVTTKLGEETSRGLAVGISKKQKEAEKAAKKTAQATAKRFKETLDSASYKYKMGEIDASEYVKSLENVRSQYAKTGDQIRKVNLEIKKVQDKHGKDLAKSSFEASKKWIDQQKKYNEMSLMEELSAWERVQARYKVGSKERADAEENVYRVKKEIHDKLSSLNDEYFKTMQDAMQKEADEVKKLRDEYQKAVDDRAKSLYNFAGIFDEIKEKSDVSGQQLIHNLQSQVETFAEWANNIKALAERGIDEGLLAELREMGPKAAAEIAALTTLSDEQLAEYASLWQTKNQLAREQAQYELVGLQEDTERKIDEIHKKSEEQLDKLRVEWETKVKQIRAGNKNEFNIMKSDMRAIGEDSMKGMIAGLESMRGSLLAKANSIVTDLKGVMTSALGIHSPSRWMRDMIGKNMMLGWTLGIDREKAATIKKAREATDWMKPDVPVVNRLRGVTAPVGNVLPISAAYSSASPITNNNSKAYNPTFNNYFTRDESTPSEVARKEKQQSQRWAMEMGMI